MNELISRTASYTQACTVGGLGTALYKKGGGNCQSIGSTASYVIVRSWLWSTETGSCPLGYFSSITASIVYN